MNEKASSYANAREFAFFFVNFNCPKKEFERLTELEKLFIYKAYENKVVNDTTYSRNAVLNALFNHKRKKNKKFIELFKKKQKKADKDYNQNAMAVILETEKKEGKSWVDRIYAGINRKRPRKGG